MNTKYRISSIASSNQLEEAITGFPSFYLSALNFPTDIDFPIPTNIRLGHLVERIVSEMIKASKNYSLLAENIQLMDDKITIGELDFLIQEKFSQQITHVELAYKFYLFDPSISRDPFQNWIGPNRNDSLSKKINKLKAKQFPLLHHPKTLDQLSNIHLGKIDQALCMLVSLYVPIDYKQITDPAYTKAIKGHYMDHTTFTRMDHSDKLFCAPNKKDWGISPSDNKDWIDFNEIRMPIQRCMDKKQAPLVWQKQNDVFSEFFVTWW